MRGAVGALAAALALAASSAVAQNYPEKPVRMLVPFPGGSATDLAARIVGQQLALALGQPFIIENRPGAGGSIAGSEVVRASPDGHTLLFSSNSAIASNVALLKNIPYDPLRDFTPVTGVGENMLVLMVNPSLPVKNLIELIAYAKERPGKLTAGYGSSSSQVCIAMLNKLAGIDTLAVPYKGIPLAVNDVIGGTLNFTFVDVGNANAQAKGGKLKPIAVTSAKRTALAPDWAPMSDVLPGFDITAWFAIVGPANLPKAIADKLHAATAKAIAQPEVKDKLASVGVAPMPLAPERLHAFMTTEVAKWKRLVKDANVTPE